MMRSSRTGALSGCIVGIILMIVLGACLLPLGFILGSVTSTSDQAIKTTGKILCPAGSEPSSYSYATTTTDENGNRQPSTAYELHCVDAGGQTVKEDPVVYGFLWIGMFAGAALILTIILAFALAAPAGVLIGRLVLRGSGTNPPSAISPA
jgi:hypothetical protein